MNFQILIGESTFIERAIYKVTERVKELSEYGYVPMGYHQVLYDNGRYTVTQGVIKN